jgi:hypothetical protein
MANTMTKPAESIDGRLVARDRLHEPIDRLGATSNMGFYVLNANLLRKGTIMAQVFDDLGHAFVHNFQVVEYHEYRPIPAAILYPDNPVDKHRDGSLCG